MRRQAPGGRGSWKMRLIIATVIALFSIISYYSKNDQNEVTGEKQRVGMSEEQEIALGLQAAPEMIEQYSGLLPNPRDQDKVDQVGAELLAALDAYLQDTGRRNPYRFEFHLLADPQTVNAFALPGGQVFITQSLYSQFKTEGQLAGVLGHEIGHVLSRHSAQRLAKQELTRGLTGAAGIAGGDIDSARMAAIIGSVVNMSYSREDELESDAWGIRLMAMADYDPRAMISVMDILAASRGGGQPEFLSTHPKPANRVAYIKEVIRREFPQGVPDGLKP